jgi:nicotinamide riboside transporter PnuC
VPKLSREPALYLTLFATIVRLLAAFVFDLTDGQQAVLNAAATAVAGLIVAIWVRRDGQLAGVLGLVQASLALAVGFGAHLTAENQALLMSAVGALAAVFIRTQVTAPVTPDGDRQI